MKQFNYKSVFDIIGPVMVGPSSSHTAGAVAIGKVAHDIFMDNPKKIIIHYFESFADTHLGHGTDYAIISGILGFKPDDKRVPKAVDIAKQEGIEITFIEEKEDSPINHPNTAVIELINQNKSLSVSGCSIGGGTIEIRNIKFGGFDICPNGPLPIILAILEDSKEEKILKDSVQKVSKINDFKTYTQNNRILDEYDLDNRLKDKQINVLRKYASKIIYLGGN